MAILAALFGFLGRFVGKLLTTTLGWASTLLFGRVPGDRQVVLAVITFGSVVWAALALGVVIPDVGTFLLAFVPAPDGVDPLWIRLGMLAGSLVVPPIVGLATIFVTEPARRPTGRAIVGQVLRGYPLSVGLALTLVLLAAVGIVRFLHQLARRWSDAHIPIVVRPGGYERVVADLERALDDAGLAVDRRPAPSVLAVPGRLLGSIAGSGIRALVPDHLVQLVGRGLEIGLYPSDIAIAGDRTSVARARAAIASRLPATAASMTTSAEAQEIEARLERLVAARVAGGAPGAGLSRLGQAGVAAELRAIDQALATLAVAHDEWEVLYRMRLQVERDLLAGSRPSAAFPGDRTDTLAIADGGAGAAAVRRDELPAWLPAAIAAAGLVLVAADVALAVLDRRRP